MHTTLTYTRSRGRLLAASLLITALCIVFAVRCLPSLAEEGHAAGQITQNLELTRHSAFGRTTSRGTYGWPMKPFHRPHFVLAYLNDPRIAGAFSSFHFGIDIWVPRPVPVYAVAAGTVEVVNGRALMVWSEMGRHAFGYWHVIASVHAHQHVEQGELLGHTLVGWNHLHFGEFTAGHWINPLRPGGIGPFADHTAPQIAGLTVRSRCSTGQACVQGRVDLVGDVFDMAPGPRPGPWRVAPALIRWRIPGARGAAAGWHVAADFHAAQLPTPRFHKIYAPGTRQNKHLHPGDYKFFLARGWNSATVADGSYVLEVAVEDVRGNVTIAKTRVAVRNDS